MNTRDSSPTGVAFRPPNGMVCFCSAFRSALRVIGSSASAARLVTFAGSTPYRMLAQPGALRARGEPEVTSKEVGRLATEALRDIDQLAYIRFASVYHSYEDISTLKREVDRLMRQRVSEE